MGKTRDKVAAQIGIGSGKQYRKAEYVANNKGFVSPSDFADWDDGKNLKSSLLNSTVYPLESGRIAVDTVIFRNKQLTDGTHYKPV